MRKTLLLSAVILGIGSCGYAAGAYAQTAPQESAATPAPAKPMPVKKPVARHAVHHAAAKVAAGDSEIRPGHEPGVGDSYPASTKASNTDAGDTKSRIAPRLPTPAGGENAGIPVYLREAQSALNGKQSGRAQEALERAETAMLQRSVPVDQAGAPDQAADVMSVETARKALARGDMAAAKKAVTAAMSASN